MALAISIQNATKLFGQKRALSDISLEVEAGSIFGFLGPNGAGKTTMIRSMMDYIRLDEGDITLLGKDAKLESAQLKTDIGYLSSDIQLHKNWTAKEHIEFFGGIKGTGRAHDLCDAFNLDVNVRVHKLSSGNKQKLAIILAFLGNPKLIIMDEPTRGLDPLLQNQLYELLRDFTDSGGTVFFSSHNLSEVQLLCDNVAVIRNGELVLVQSMDEVLKLNVHYITASFADPLQLKDFKKSFIKIVKHDERSLELKVKGNLDEVLRMLTKHTMQDLEVRHATLEEVFMEYYND